MRLNEIIDDIYETLEDYKPYYGWFNEDRDEDIQVTFHIYNNIDSHFLDDEAQLQEDSLQIDIWGKDYSNVNDTYEDIKQLLKGKDGYYYSECNSDFETDTGLFHNSLRYKINR